jgi:hypothetical protein
MRRYSTMMTTHSHAGKGSQVAVTTCLMRCARQGLGLALKEELVGKKTSKRREVCNRRMRTRMMRI